jgi:HK97 family phage portal protein
MRGLLGSLVGGEKKSTSENPASWFVDWVRGGEPTTSGIHVTADSAMRQSAAVWACVRNRADDIGKVPCILYRKLPDGGKERADDHPLYNLIRYQPNPYQTAFEFKQLMQAWMDLEGNAYGVKEYVRGKIVAIHPAHPHCVTVLRVPGTSELFYKVQLPGEEAQTIPAEGIVHLRGLTLNGYVGVSPITYHRETIGLAIGAQRYGAAFFGNSAQPNGALKVPHLLEPAAADKLRADWEQKFRGAENAHRLAIFDGGMEWVQTGMNNVDAQYLEARKFQNQQIYALYRMPPHKVGDLDRSTNNNIEHQALEYVGDCLMPEFTRWEQALRRDLLTDAEQKSYFFEFMTNALLRGDFASRMAGYAIARNWGIYSADDVRDFENMNRLPNGKGAIYLQPLNMVEAGAPPTPKVIPPLPEADPDEPEPKAIVAEVLREIEHQSPPLLTASEVLEPTHEQ